MEKAYKNLGYFLLILIPLTLLGFHKTYFGQFPNFNKSTNTYIHLHAFIASIWILMLIIQPILIRNKNNTLHKRIGKASYFIFPLLILSFVPQIIRLIISDHSMVVFFPLADSIVLTIFYSLAIYFRKNISKHMRFMIGSASVFLGPTFGRIGINVLGLSESVTQNLQYGIIYVIFIALIMLDLKNKKIPTIFVDSRCLDHSSNSIQSNILRPKGLVHKKTI
ncbi:MAG: hypothetical protein ACI9IP_001564 [Arcticibacterium sp.]|jgi:hypothetical protein